MRVKNVDWTLVACSKVRGALSHHSLVPSLRTAWDVFSVFEPCFFITTIYWILSDKRFVLDFNRDYECDGWKDGWTDQWLYRFKKFETVFPVRCLTFQVHRVPLDIWRCIRQQKRLARSRPRRLKPGKVRRSLTARQHLSSQAPAKPKPSRLTTPTSRRQLVRPRGDF